jgi:hypothetical protein
LPRRKGISANVVVSFAPRDLAVALIAARRPPSIGRTTSLGSQHADLSGSPTLPFRASRENPLREAKSPAILNNRYIGRRITLAGFSAFDHASISAFEAATPSAQTKRLRTSSGAFAQFLAGPR